MPNHRGNPMPRILRTAATFLSVLAVSACVPTGTLKSPLGQKAGTETEVIARGPVVECQGKLRASIAISRFDNKVRNWDTYNAGIGEAMADQLTTALVSTGCFKVVDRQNLKGVMDELGLQQSGAVDRRTASKVGKLVGADIIVTAAVTEFKEDASGTRGGAGAGVGGGLIGVLGALASAVSSAHMAADLRITDVQTSEILGATAVKGKATDVNQAAALGALFPGVGGGLGALQSWENTPRGAALRQVIEEAVTAIHKMIPQGYYRHSVGRFGKAPQAIGTGTAGASGANNVVTKAQRTLKALGLYDGAVDGLAGPRTERAIRAFQEQVGIDPTGKLDVRTMKELDGMSR